MADIYKIFTLTCHADSQGGAVHLPDLESQSMRMNNTLLASIMPAHQSPNHIAVAVVDVMHELTTRALKAILDITGAKGIEIDSGSNPGMTVYLQKFANTGGPVAGAVHRSLNIKKGVMVPQSLTVESGGNAKLSVVLIPIEKTGNDPVVVSDTATLPTITVGPEAWTLGPIEVGGYTLADYTRLTVNFGNEIETTTTQSDVYPTKIAVKSHAPTALVEGIDPKWFLAANIAIGGKVATHANTIIHLRHRTQDAAHFVASGVATHIKFTMAGLGMNEQVVGGEAVRPSESSLLITAAVDASGNDPLSISTVSTHP